MYLAAIFQESIERGIQSGELKSDMNAKAIAQALVISLIGVTVMMKSHPDELFMRNSLHVILQSLE